MSAALTARVLMAFLFGRLACLLGLAHRGRAGLPGAVRGYDGGWYRRIVEHGYPQTLAVDQHGLLRRNPIAFFPVFPQLVRPFTQAGAPYWAAALAVNTVAGAVAAVLIAAVARRHTGSDQAGLLAAALWSVLPASFVLSMAYSEAVFVALAAGCLLALANDRWLVAGLLAAVASATRPTGVALVLACGVGAVAAVAHWPPGIRARLMPFLAPLLAPLGIVAYFGYLWHRYHRPDAWFAVEREGWHAGANGGAVIFGKMGRALLGDAPKPSWVYVAVVIMTALALLVWAVWDRLPAAQLAFCAAVIALTLTSGVYSSVPRMLLPAFPLLTPLAARLARLPWPVGAIVWTAALPGLTYASFALLGNLSFAP